MSRIDALELKAQGLVFRFGLSATFRRHLILGFTDVLNLGVLLLKHLAVHQCTPASVAVKPRSRRLDRRGWPSPAHWKRNRTGERRALIERDQADRLPIRQGPVVRV